MNEYPSYPDEGSTHIVCVNLVSLQGSTLTALTVGNKNGRNFLAKNCDMYRNESVIVDAMIENQQKFIWVKAVARINGKNTDWVVLDSAKTVLERINTGKSACVPCFYTV